MVEFIHLAGLGFAADLALVLFLAIFHASGSLGLMPSVELVVAGGGNGFCLGMAGIVLADVVNLTRYAAVARAGDFFPLMAKSGSFARLFLMAHRASTVFFTFALTGSGGFYCPLAVGVETGGGGVVILIGMAGIMGAGVLIVALCATGGGHRGLYIVMCIGVNICILRPLVFMLRVDSVVIFLKGAFVLHPAIFRAVGILVVGLMFGAEVLAMHDLLQYTIEVGIPQLRIIANGIYKAACCGVTSCAYRSLGTVHTDILTIRRCPLFHFKQHIVADVDLSSGNCAELSGYCTVLADLNFSVLSAINGHHN